MKNKYVSKILLLKHPEGDCSNVIKFSAVQLHEVASEKMLHDVKSMGYSQAVRQRTLTP